MSSTSSCTFRPLFDAKSPARPEAVEAFVGVLKRSKAQRVPPGWLRNLVKANYETSSLVYLRAVLSSSQLTNDQELRQALEQAWGSKDIDFCPSNLFPPQLEPQPLPDILNEVKTDPIAYIQKVLGDKRTEAGWLRKELFPGAEKWLKESEKRMLRLQVCLLVGIGNAPNSIQNAWGISKSVFRYILTDLRGLFEAPISAVTDKALSTAPTKSYRSNPSSMGIMARLLPPSEQTTTSSLANKVPAKSKDDSLSCNAEIASEPTASRTTPSPDQEGNFFIEEDLAPVVEEGLVPSSTVTRPSQSSLRKTVATVLSPFAAIMARGRNPTDSTSSLAGVETRPGSLQEGTPKDGGSYLEAIAPPMLTACAEDGEAIEVALDGENKKTSSDTSTPSTGKVNKKIRMDLDRMLALSIDKAGKEIPEENAFSQLNLLRHNFEQGELQAHTIEIQTKGQDMKFCQVFESETVETFEKTAELYGWLDRILEASVTSKDPNEAAKFVVGCIGEKYPEALVAVAEEFGFMKVVGPEI
jgi:hypothetical protein